MILEILNQQLGDELVLSSGRKERTASDESTKNSQSICKVIIPEKFKNDIAALKEYIGEENFIPGASLQMSLKELLKVIKRDRAKSDAYSSLVKFLKEGELNISLSIYSQKSKKYEI